MPHQTPELQQLINAEPDLVDRIFDYLLAEVPEISACCDRLKSAVRTEFAGEQVYIADRPQWPRQALTQAVLSLFNGRNASEVARRLNVSRATVYRVLKQPGRQNRLIFLEMRQDA